MRHFSDDDTAFSFKGTFGNNDKTVNNTDTIENFSAKITNGDKSSTILNLYGNNGTSSDDQIDNIVIQTGTGANNMRNRK